MAKVTMMVRKEDRVELCPSVEVGTARRPYLVLITNIHIHYLDDRCVKRVFLMNSTI